MLADDELVAHDAVDEQQLKLCEEEVKGNVWLRVKVKVEERGLVSGR